MRILICDRIDSGLTLCPVATERYTTISGVIPRQAFLFELLNQPIEHAEGYEFISAEVKEKAFRADLRGWLKEAE